MGLLIAVHVLGAVIWVGGMFFAYTCLRPSVGVLEPPQRCSLWRAVLGRFFAAVWIAALAVIASGYAMIFGVYGSMGGAPAYVNVMHALGWLMFGLFAHVYFAPFAKLRRAVEAQDWPDAAAQIGRIRPIVAVNLALGLATIALAASGRWWS